MVVVEVPKKWDNESDVIIIGGGTAGLPAGVIVAEAGFKATILESRPAVGGSFNMVAGTMAFAGTEEEKSAGVDDSPEVFYQDEITICGADTEIARAFADNQLDAYRMLKEEGVTFPGLVPHPAHTRNRCHGWLEGVGPQLVRAVEGRANRKGVEILLRHRATKLIADPQTGKVIGVQVETRDGMKNFKAKRAVIIASGGFGRNHEMVAEYAPEMADCVPKMPVGHMGDGLKMGLAIGAATKDISHAVAPSWPVCAETHSNALWVIWWGGIMVNVDGKRFHNESSAEAFYGPMTASGMRQPGSVYWVVFDDSQKKNVINDSEAHLSTIDKCKQYKADTFEEMAKLAGIDPKGLRETIEKYNSDVTTAGYDTVYGRNVQFGGSDRPLVKLEVPPFYAIKCVTSTTSMKGGLRINGRCQVIDQFGDVIPGLYAAGEVAGGLHTKNYLLGVMSSSAMTQGIIAARNAVKEPAA